MNKSTVVWLKVLVWIACLWPLGLLVYGAVGNNLGADPSAKIELSTGYTALVILLISLAITPVRKLVPKLGWLIRFRRLLGMFAFFYATVHLLAYVGLYAGFDVATIVEDVTRRRFITVGVVAWVILLPLALTSTTWAIRKLGGKRWNLLHKLVYLAVIAGVVHFWWQGKPGVMTALPLTVVMAVLLASRVGFGLAKKLA